MASSFPYRSKYRILGKIGQGQFGQVYFAIHRSTGDLVALKNLGKGFPTNRFLREFSYLIRLSHPNIVACRAIEHHRKGRYLVMDYCEGGTLRNLMDASGQLSLEMRLNLVTDVLAGLDYAHQQNIIHCDIKPENILLNLTAQGWKAKITDFGIAKLGQETLNSQLESGYTGSPAYMAPERFYGKYSERCDLYSVGIILYELIVGERPFSGLPSELMLAHLNQRIMMPDAVPDDLKRIIIKALEKLPKRRFSSAREMREEINGIKQNFVHLSENFLTSLPTQQTLSISNYNSIVSFDNPITNLAIDNQTIYVGTGKQLTCVNYQVDPSAVKLNQRWQISLTDSIKTIELRSSNCFILTQQLNQQSLQYSLYRFPENFTTTANLDSQYLFSLNAYQLVSAIDLNEGWLAVVSNTDKKQVTAYFQLFKLSNLLPLHAPVTCPLPSQIIALDSRHGLVIFPGDSQDNKQTFLYLFNRRGRFIKSFSCPLLLDDLTSNPVSPYELFGVEKVKPYYGILIKLKPLKISRIALNFMPKFIIAEAWGYGLANEEGKLCLLSREGHHVAHFELSLTITAMTSFGDSGLLIASDFNGRGNLVTIDLRSIIEFDDCINF